MRSSMRSRVLLCSGIIVDLVRLRKDLTKLNAKNNFKYNKEDILIETTDISHYPIVGGVNRVCLKFYYAPTAYVIHVMIKYG